MKLFAVLRADYGAQDGGDHDLKQAFGFAHGRAMVPGRQPAA